MKWLGDVFKKLDERIERWANNGVTPFAYMQGPPPPPPPPNLTSYANQVASAQSQAMLNSLAPSLYSAGALANLLGGVAGGSSMLYGTIATPSALAAPRLKALPRGLVAGPILAWRQWFFTRDSHGVIQLESINNHEVWSAGVTQVAHCQMNPVHHAMAQDISPVPECTCGLFAMKTEMTPFNSNIVVGQVALWGRVIEHKDGYRAQYAYPYRLILPRGPRMAGFPTSKVFTDLVEGLRNAYGCIVEVR